MVTSILDYLETTARRLPEKTALADDRLCLSFGEWLQQAKSIGTAIAQSTDSTIRRAVLVFVDRRIEGVVGAMGVVESGNFYVPIDCKMPFERVRLIADVCKPIAAVATTDKDLQILDQIEFAGPRFLYNEVKELEADKEVLSTIRGQIIDLDPVYSIFTSGSTGVPKGVVISHRGMIDLANWLVETFEFSERDALGNQTPFYFDGSVKDIAVCIKSGATLNVIGKKYFTFTKLLMPLLNERKITAILWATSAIVLVGNSDILNVALPEHLRLVTFAGEAMPAKQLRAWQEKLPNVRFVNLYGPTEITVDCTFFDVRRQYADDEYIPIGKACQNMQVMVLKDDDTEASVDEVGELCVRGSGVALGYYGNRAKTDEVFVQNPLNPFFNDIIYRTGDLVKPAEDGNLVFVSRKDFQVKHKGNRIELGEIEVAVNAIEGVTNAACIFDQTNDKIVLYYTTMDGQPIEIINLVKERIPAYMFPEVVNHLAQMPYNLNGKIDRIALRQQYEAEQRCP